MRSLIILTFIFHISLLSENLCQTGSIYTPPPYEKLCFSHFNHNASGRHDINQYLLAQVNRLVFPDKLSSDLGYTFEERTLASHYGIRTAHWFHDHNARPKRPEFPEHIWVTLKRSCQGNKLSQAEWTELENLYYEFSENTRPTNLANNNLGTGIKRANTVSKHDLGNARLDGAKLDKSDMQRLVQQDIQNVNSLTSNRVYRELTKANSPLQTPLPMECKTAVDNFVNAVNNFKMQMDRYQSEMTAFINSIPDFHFIKRTTSLLGFDEAFDPEAILINTKDYIIIAFRGTDIYLNRTENENITNIGVSLVPLMNHTRVSGRVHSGYYFSVSTIVDPIVALLSRYNARGKKIWIAGTSLGGGQATVLSMILTKQYNFPVHSLYTYGGMNSVGDITFANNLRSHFGTGNSSRHQRFEVKDDYVASLDMRVIPNNSYAIAGARCYYNGTTYPRNFSFSWGHNEHFGLLSPLSLLSFLFNLATKECNHDMNTYCRVAYFNLQHNRTNQTILNNMPRIPSNPCI